MEGLTYEPLNPSHADGLLSVWADADVIRFTNIKEPCTLPEILENIKTLEAFDVFAVSDAGGLIGVIGCPWLDRENNLFGLFYHFRKSSWGKGYATMAAEWLLQFMKRNYTEARFLAEVVVGNAASEKLLKHLGFTLLSEKESGIGNGSKRKLRCYQL